MKAVCYYPSGGNKVIGIVRIEDDADPVEHVLQDLKRICERLASEQYSLLDWMQGYGPTTKDNVPQQLSYHYVDPTVVDRIEKIDVMDLQDWELDELAEVEDLSSLLLRQIYKIFGAEADGTLTSEPTEHSVTVPEDMYDVFKEGAEY